MEAQIGKFGKISEDGLEIYLGDCWMKVGGARMKVIGMVWMRMMGIVWKMMMGIVWMKMMMVIV